MHTQTQIPNTFVNLCSL